MMETIDERELQKNNKRKTREARRKKGASGTEAISVRAK